MSLFGLDKMTTELACRGRFDIFLDSESIIRSIKVLNLKTCNSNS